MEVHLAPSDFSAVVLQAIVEARAARKASLDELCERQPQDVFEALLGLHVSFHAAEPTANNKAVLRTMWVILRQLDARALSRMDLLWETVLATEEGRVAPLHVATTLALLLGSHTIVPADAGRRGKERGDGFGRAVWLLSDDASVPGGVRQLLAGPQGPFREVLDCVKVAVVRHGIDVMPQLKRDVAQRRAYPTRLVSLLLAAGVQYEDEAIFSEDEWCVLLSEAPGLEQMAKLYQRGGRPSYLVSKFLGLVREVTHLEGALLAVSHWLTQREADELIALYDGPTFGNAYEQACFLGCLLSRSSASPSVRFAVLRKRLEHSPAFHYEVEHEGADWAAFNNAQLSELIHCCRDLLGHIAVANELCRRRLVPLQLPAFVRDKMRGQGLVNSQALALCRYAVQNIGLFESVQLDAKVQARASDRAVVYAIVGRWTREAHPYLPHGVQAVAMVTLWALTWRMGTRHLVYRVLELALRAPRVPPTFAVGLPRVRSVIALLRGK
jgi:hypothetical protein